MGARATTVMPPANKIAGHGNMLTLTEAMSWTISAQRETFREAFRLA